MSAKKNISRKESIDIWIRQKPFALRIVLYVPVVYFQVFYFLYKYTQLKIKKGVLKWQAYRVDLKDKCSATIIVFKTKINIRKKSNTQFKLTINKLNQLKPKRNFISENIKIKSKSAIRKIDSNIIFILATIDNFNNKVIISVKRSFEKLQFSRHINLRSRFSYKISILKTNKVHDFAKTNEASHTTKIIETTKKKSKKLNKNKKVVDDSKNNIFILHTLKTFLTKDINLSFINKAFSIILIKPVKKVLYVILYPFRLLKRVLHAIFNFEIRIKIFHPITIMLVLIIGAIYVLSVFYFSILEDMPDSNQILQYDPQLTTRIYDRKGNLLYKVYQDEDRTYVTLDKIPKDLINATIAIEDKDFYKHKGLSTTGIIRAAKKTFLEEDLQGGSTITQQLVKNVLLTPDRTIERKVKEAILSVEVERKLSKDEILEMYLNTISYGGTAYGVEAAARKYFGKPLDELDLAECSFLAGLPAAPSVYSPFTGSYKLAKARQKEVLQRMVEDGYITQEEADEAYDEGFIFAYQNQPMKAPHFVNYVLAKLEDKFGQQLVTQGGLDVYTSLDPELQKELENIVKTNVNELSKYNVHNGAALITNPQTGEILAMVGSVDFWDKENDGNVNVTISPRQPGSSIKPILYSLALESGKFTPNSKIKDAPVVYKFAGSKPYKPVNYDGKYHGTVTLKMALANSYNIPAVKILNALGVDNFINHAQRMGITTWTDRSRYGLSLALGAGEVKMVDMATAYGVFANGGYKKDLDPILKVYDSFGFLLYENGCANLLKDGPSILTRRAILNVSAEAKDSSSVYASDAMNSTSKNCKREKVLSSLTAYNITKMLSDNKARLPAFGSRNNLAIKEKRVAVKTGTTNNEKDNWAIGYTKNYLVAAWIGNNDGQIMKGVVSGYHGASNIWRDAFDYLIKHREVDDSVTLPEGYVEVEICPLTKTLACEGCPNEKRIYKRGTEPKYHCSPEIVKKILEEKSKDKDKNKDSD